MDRRHFVLAIAVVAAIASEPDQPPRLFWGREDLDGGSLTLDAMHPTRSWIITTTVVLPAEAADHDFQSFSTVRADLGEGAQAYPVSLSLSACSEPVETVYSEENPNGRLVAADIDDPFVDCVPLEPCTRTMCAQLANGDENAGVELDWFTYSVVASDEPVDDKGDESIPVAIDITIEDGEP
jgi:hypothetical protein